MSRCGAHRRVQGRPSAPGDAPGRRLLLMFAGARISLSGPALAPTGALAATGCLVPSPCGSCFGWSWSCPRQHVTAGSGSPAAAFSLCWASISTRVSGSASLVMTSRDWCTKTPKSLSPCAQGRSSSGRFVSLLDQQLLVDRHTGLLSRSWMASKLHELS